VLFNEYVPEPLRAWFGDRLSGERLYTALVTAIFRVDERLHDDVTFMNDRGMLHLDLHASNMLTGAEWLWAANCGLALRADFDLSRAERALFETDRPYGRCQLSERRPRQRSPMQARSLFRNID
jgi:streptomycin 6-kinase